MIAITYGDTSREAVVNSKDVSIRQNDSGTAKIQMLLPKEITGDPRFYLGHGQFQPGSSVAEHVHEKSVEIIYVIKGTGQFAVAGKKYDIAPGTAIYIPENTPHSFLNNGKDRVEIIQLYSPAGPEDRFLQWKEISASAR